jgi:hypothetical protein
MLIKSTAQLSMSYLEQRLVQQGLNVRDACLPSRKRSHDLQGEERGAQGSTWLCAGPDTAHVRPPLPMPLIDYD